jgi:hypothetical protein
LLIIGWVQIGLAGVFLFLNVGSSLIALLRNAIKALKMLCRSLMKGMKSKEEEKREQTEEKESSYAKEILDLSKALAFRQQSSNFLPSNNKNDY